MVYALMFDNFQNRVRDDQWCVSRSGSIQFCRQYDTLTDDYVPWAKADFSDRVKREDHPVYSESGAIYELTPVANFAATLDDVASRRLEPIAPQQTIPIGWVMGGFLAGVLAGLVLHGLVPNPFSGDDR